MITRRRFSQSVTSLALVGSAPWARAEPEKIVLGQSAPITGPAAQLGIQFHAGARVAFDQANSVGGVAGRLIELKILDDGYEPERCVENTRKFIEDDVFALFGYLGTPTSLAALPLATKAKIPLVAPLTGAMGLRSPFNRYAFHIRASYNDETGLIVKQLTNLGLRRIAVFYQNDAYGKAGLDGVTLALTALGLQPVAAATVERNSVDVGKAVHTISAANPEAIIQISAYKSCAAFIRAARESGFGGLFYNVSFVGTQALADELGKAGAGVVITQVVPSPYVLSHPISREFAEAIRQVGGGQVKANFSSMEGYIAGKVMLEGLHKAAGHGGREGFISAMESLSETNVGGFKVSFSRTDHVASSYVELALLTGDGKVRS